MSFSEWPGWLGEGILAAVAAAVGFIGKTLYDHWRERQSKKGNTLAELRVLHGLLDESFSVFKSQNYMARRLLKMVEQNHADLVAGKRGFDDKFCAAFPALTPEEAELHAIIRSTSMNSMHRVNSSLKAWLDKNPNIVHDLQKHPQLDVFQTSLGELELHLNLWFDKFNAMIPNDPKRALVYLADEKKQGIEFPKKLTPALKEILGSLT